MSFLDLCRIFQWFGLYWRER